MKDSLKENLKFTWLGLFNTIIFNNDLSVNQKIEELKKSIQQYKGRLIGGMGFSISLNDITSTNIECYISNSQSSMTINPEKNPFERIINGICDIMIEDMAQEMVEKSREITPEIVYVEKNPTFWGRISKKSIGGIVK